MLTKEEIFKVRLLTRIKDTWIPCAPRKRLFYKSWCEQDIAPPLQCKKVTVRNSSRREYVVCPPDTSPLDCHLGYYLFVDGEEVVYSLELLTQGSFNIVYMSFFLTDYNL